MTVVHGVVHQFLSATLLLESEVDGMQANEFERKLLRAWDSFVQSRSLPYFRDDHELMMRQVLNRYPPGKLGDLSDGDLVDCVNLDDGSEQGRLRRSFRHFITHFDQFLERNNISR